ncbi:MAG: DUF5916 domain-containing protein [Candidatus Krumholzibacteriia bacterium]
MHPGWTIAPGSGSSAPGAARSGPLSWCLLLLATLSVASPAWSAGREVGIPGVPRPMLGFEPHVPDSPVPDLADGRCTQPPVLRAQRVDAGAVVLDGCLDDAGWRLAPAARGFMQFDPIRGAPATEETVFKIVYDDEALYLGAACYERDPDRTSSRLSRRDQLADSDFVSIYVDPYHDHVTGYNFRVNRHGVQEDHYLFADGERDRDWDAVWQAETSHDEHGWYLEVRIPFSAMRYRPAEEMSWGLQVYRWMHGRGEDTAWVIWDRHASGFVSRWGALTGLAGIPAARSLELVPYVVAGGTDPAAPPADDAWQDARNAGLDLKYGLTADLTLNATIQPDFGQVESDPALLNLSPFETFYSEKRPFFVEGARFFEHPSFRLFYSRRIGTGGENARIRVAGKLTGKTRRGISVAALAAQTDVTAGDGIQNPFAAGDDRTWYGVVRLGKEFSGGDHRVHLMQTAVARNRDSRLGDDGGVIPARDAWTTGLDFQLHFAERTYRVQGSLVGSVVDPAPLAAGAGVDQAVLATFDHSARHGTGGTFDVAKIGGRWQGGLFGHWKTDRLDLNDLGFLSTSDQISAYGWVAWNHDRDGRPGGLFNSGRVQIEASRDWLYAGSERRDTTGDLLWSYGAGKPALAHLETSTQWQTRNFWRLNGGAWIQSDGISKYATRTFAGERGPLLATPSAGGAWAGISSDWRRPLRLRVDGTYAETGSGSVRRSVSGGLDWTFGDHLAGSVSLRHERYDGTDQWLTNLATPDEGIGGVSYVFSHIEQRTWDLTLRTNLLLDRRRSLELYLQPFLTVGDYFDPRSLARPESFDLRPFAAPGFDVADHDFTFGAVNLNLVYRWEYRPGSAFFLVWSHSRDSYLERGDLPEGRRLASGLDSGPLLQNEPQNRVLVKLTYWFSI